MGITLLRSVTMFCGTDNIPQNNQSECGGICRDIMWNTINPTKHCYGFEYCYGVPNLFTYFGFKKNYKLPNQQSLVLIDKKNQNGNKRSFPSLTSRKATNVHSLVECKLCTKIATQLQLSTSLS